MGCRVCGGRSIVAPRPSGLAMWTLVLLGALVVAGCRQTGPSAPGSATEGIASPSGSSGGAPAAADAGQPASNLMPTGLPGQTVRTPEPPPLLLTARPPGLAVEGSGTPTAVAETGIAGTVTDTQGQPIVDVAVTIVESSQPVPAMAAFTDAQGHYLWRVGPGTYTVEAYRDGYRTARQEVTVEKGQVAEAHFRLEPQ